MAEDFSDARELYEVYLTRQGFEVVAVANGEDALARAQELQPDLVLMDMSLPVVDGYSATEALKNDARTRDIPVVALTGHVMEKHLAEARDAGCDTVVPKPCLPSELAAKIRSMLPESKPETD